MRAYVSNPPYTALEAVGEETTSGSVLFPEFWVGIDEDDNGIYDGYELLLAEKFCPYVYIHKDNIMIPSPVQVLLDNTSLCSGSISYPGIPSNIHYDTDRDPISTEEAFNLFQDSWDSNWWLDFGGINLPRGENFWHSYYNSIKSHYSTPIIYTHCFKYKYNTHAIIQYWFYYPFNDWGGDHEGDWEHINVKVTTQIPNDANPLEVVYYFHKKRKTLSWNNTYHVDNHPYVYVGGHVTSSLVDGEESGASYPWPGHWFDVAGPVGEEIWPDRHINPSDFDLINIMNNNNLWWMRFPGHWGVPKEMVNSGIVENYFENDAPRSPRHHECWGVYQHENYEEYE